MAYTLDDLVFKDPDGPELDAEQHNRNISILAQAIIAMAGGAAAVLAVNGQTGTVNLTAEDVGALAESALATINAAIAEKAATTDVNAALSSKASTAALASKADTSALATKADTSALATKADTSYVDGQIATKANSADVTAALADKANSADVASALAAKADTTALATKADASALTAKADKSYVDTQLAGKVGTADGRLADRRQPAVGDYGAISFAIVEDALVATLAGAAVRNALATLTEGNRLDWTAVKGFSSAGFGAIVQQAVIAACGLEPGDRLGAVAPDGMTFLKGSSTVISFAKLDEYLTGANENLLVTVGTARYMGLTRERAYDGTTMTLVLDGARIMDGGAHDSDGLVTEITNISSNLTINFDDIHAGLEGESLRVRCVIEAVSNYAIGFGSANGITIDANGLANPAATSWSAAVGDALEIIATIVSPTLIRIDRYVEDTA